MEQNTPSSNNNNTSQEIDLWGIFQKAGKWCLKVIQSVAVFLFGFFFQNIFWIIGCIVLGVVAGVVNYKLSTPYYASTMQFRNNVLNSAYFVNSINNTFNSQDLAKKMAMPDSLAEQILSINACYGIDINKDGIADLIDTKGQYIVGDSSSAAKVIHNDFYIDVRAESAGALPYIREAVLKLIANDPYVRLRNQERILAMTEQLKDISQQTTRLDSLQRFDYFENDQLQARRSSSQLLILNEKDRKLYHNEILSLNERRTNLQLAIELYSEPVTVIQEFPAMEIQHNQLSTYLIPRILFYFLFGCFILIIWRYWNPIRKFYRSL